MGSQPRGSICSTQENYVFSSSFFTLPDFGQPFILEADASRSGIGAVLMQQGRPISFLSKTLGPYAAALSTYEKEALAILEAIKKMETLFGKYFNHYQN